jgi:hypothetical protein
MVTADNFKVIDDPRTRSIEVFDLRLDPRELKNLYDERDPSITSRYDVLRTFFSARTLHRDGYEVPYRKW